MEDELLVWCKNINEAIKKLNLGTKGFVLPEIF